MNYAYGQNSQPFNLHPFTQQLAGLNQFQTGAYNSNPDLALETFIRSINPSLTQTDTLRRMFTSLQNQWQSQQINNMSQSPQSFLDFLSKYNYGKEMASLDPSSRRENPQAFMRPVRTVTF